MEFEWDPAKNAANGAKHGLSFETFQGWDDAPVIVADTRFDYGEPRWLGLGRIAGLPHAISFTMRGTVMRLISFRRAHEEELARYE